MDTTLDYFDFYSKLGWKIVPIRPESKVPIFKNWNKVYSISKSRKYIEGHPNCNIGLLLGDIVDVEGDSELANSLLDECVIDTEHPCFASSKSKHHLFLSPSKNLTRIKKHDIEFRGALHYSMVPPSIHPDGTKYEWIQLTALGKMPKALEALYRSITKKPVKRRKRKTHIAPWCAMCGKQEEIHRTRFNKELLAFKSLGLKWFCHKCRTVDVRPICKHLR